MIVEIRAAAVGDVAPAARLVSVIAAPYDELAAVEYRGAMWQERFLRGAFDGIETSKRQVRANREHVIGRTVGAVTAWHPSRTEGLVADIRMARTQLGDETLQLAEDGMISPSVGFYLRSHADQRLNPALRLREITRAGIDHLSLVEHPAYAGAKVLAVRHT